MEDHAVHKACLELPSSSSALRASRREFRAVVAADTTWKIARPARLLINASIEAAIRSEPLRGGNDGVLKVCSLQPPCQLRL